MFRVWSEWDIGEEYLVFKSRAAALQWLEDNLNIQEILKAEGYEGIEELIEGGLVGIGELEVVE